MSGGEDPLNRGAMAWREPDEKIKALYAAMIGFKKEHRDGLNITEMRMQDGVLCLTLSGGDYMAYIAEPSGNKHIAAPGGMSLRFGDASLECGYAFFEKK